MRVRILKNFITANDAYSSGEVREVDTEKAQGWLRAGLIMQDKSFDGGKETKAPLYVSNKDKAKQVE